jgi:hypothetical protein
MTDDLKQLLRDADATAPIPSVDATSLPYRIRRTARNQRRVAACGLAIGMVMLMSPLFLRHLDRGTSSPAPTFVKSNDLDIELLERTVALLETRPARPQRVREAPDAFLANLQMERNRAALTLLRDADRQVKDNQQFAADALRRTIQLFPDTPAAATANQRLEQLEPTKKQS